MMHTDMHKFILSVNVKNIKIIKKVYLFKEFNDFIDFMFQHMGC